MAESNQISLHMVLECEVQASSMYRLMFQIEIHTKLFHFFLLVSEFGWLKHVFFLSFIRGGCRSLSGTSVASPVVAGAVSLLLR